MELAVLRIGPICLRRGWSAPSEFGVCRARRMSLNFRICVYFTHPGHHHQNLLAFTPPPNHSTRLSLTVANLTSSRLRQIYYIFERCTMTLLIPMVSD